MFEKYWQRVMGSVTMMYIGNTVDVIPKAASSV